MRSISVAFAVTILLSGLGTSAFASREDYFWLNPATTTIRQPQCHCNAADSTCKSANQGESDGTAPSGALNF